MDNNYIKEHTKDWSLLHSHGNFELYSFFDDVDWGDRYAIKRSGEVVYTFSDGVHGDNYNFFYAVCIIG